MSRFFSHVEGPNRPPAIQARQARLASPSSRRLVTDKRCVGELERCCGCRFVIASDRVDSVRVAGGKEKQQNPSFSGTVPRGAAAEMNISERVSE